MIKQSDLIEIGRILKTHGVKGEVSCVFDDVIIPDELEFIIIELDGIYVPFYKCGIRTGNGKRSLITFEGINNETEAARLASKPIYILKDDYDKIVDELRDSDKIYLEDLIGFTILNYNNTVGIIEGIDDRTENVLFIVAKNNDESLYIPAIDIFIEDIDFEQKKIKMRLPEGLTDL